MAGSSIFASNRSSSASESGCVGVLINDPHRKREASGSRISFPEGSFLAALSDRARELGIFLYVFRPEGLDPGAAASLDTAARAAAGRERKSLCLRSSMIAARRCAVPITAPAEMRCSA